jgi:hypothetical protein
MGNPINTGPGNNVNSDVFFNNPSYDPPCPPGVFTVNSLTIGFFGSGSTCVPLTASVIISKHAGNSLQILQDGLYASGGTGGGSVTSVFGRAGVVVAQQSDYASFYYPLSSNPAGYLTGTTAAGSNTQVQFNNNGALGASANLVWDSTDSYLGIGITPTYWLNIGVSPNSLGHNTHIGLTLVSNATTATYSFGGIEFIVPTTGAIGDLLFTASNYAGSGGQAFIQPNSIGLQTFNGSIFLYSGGAAGYMSFAAGNTVNPEWMRLFATGNLVISSLTNLGSNVLTDHASAILSLESTTKGFLEPVMTSVQRNAIASPVTGLQVYDSTVGAPYYYDGANWQQFSKQFASGVTNPISNIGGSIGLIVSPNAGNILTIQGNGLYASGGTSSGGTNFISGVTNPLQVISGIASLKVSATSGNLVQTLSDGLYTSASTGGSPAISNNFGNRIIGLGNGLYASGSTGYFNVKDYGLLDDNTTDNSAALTSLINNTVPVYGGTIYFPGGGAGYLFKSTITINKNISIKGDGKQAYKFFALSDTPLKGSTNLYFNTSGTTFLSFVNNPGVNAYITFSIRDLSIINTSVAIPISGSTGIFIDNVSQHFTLDNICVSGFYTNVNVSSGMLWNMNNCDIISPVKYSLIINNSVNPDAGGWHITATNFCSGFISGNSSVGVYIKGGGGGYMSGCFFNAQTDLVTQCGFTYGIFSDFSAGQTSDIRVTNCFFENFQLSAIKLTTLSGPIFNIQITDCEIAPENSLGTSLAAIDITGFSNIQIDGIVATNSFGGISHPVVNLTSCANIYIGSITNDSYSSSYATTSCTAVSYPFLVTQASSSVGTQAIMTNLDDVDASSGCKVQLQGNAGSTVLGRYNQGTTPYGLLAANSSWLYTNGAIMSLMVDSAAGVMNLGVGSAITVPQLLINNNGIIMSGSVAYNYTEVSSTYTAANTDGTINATSGTFNITLPFTSTTKGRVYIIKNTGTGVVTVLPGFSTQTIDGLSAYPLAQNQSITIISNGHNGSWLVTAKSTPLVTTTLVSYSILTTDNTILVNSAASGTTMTLPAASNALGNIFNIKKIDSSVNAVTISAVSGNIDGVSNKIISIQYDSVSVVSDGSNYYLI